GCLVELGKVVDVRGSSVRVVKWSGKEGSGVMGDGEKIGWWGEQYLI
nr:hypothetical protein [Tanacetum cinerariifolium]